MPITTLTPWLVINIYSGECQIVDHVLWAYGLVYIPLLNPDPKYKDMIIRKAKDRITKEIDKNRGVSVYPNFAENLIEVIQEEILLDLCGIHSKSIDNKDTKE